MHVQHLNTLLALNHGFSVAFVIPACDCVLVCLCERVYACLLAVAVTRPVCQLQHRELTEECCQYARTSHDVSRYTRTF